MYHRNLEWTVKTLMKRHGVADYRFGQGGKHPYVEFYYHGQRHKVVYSRSMHEGALDPLRQKLSRIFERGHTATSP